MHCKDTRKVELLLITRAYSRANKFLTANNGAPIVVIYQCSSWSIGIVLIASRRAIKSLLNRALTSKANKFLIAKNGMPIIMVYQCSS